MKVIASGLLAHFQQTCTTVAVCLRVTRSDAEVVGFTTHDRALEVDGVTYYPGFEVSSLASNDTLAVDNMELRFLALDDLLPADDLIAGRWNNAQFEIFQLNAESPSDGTDVLKRGNTGEVKISRGTYVVELLSLKQALQQTQSIVTNRTCRARLGSTGPSGCNKDLTAFTFTGSFTSVTSSRVMADSGRGEADDYFGNGLLTITSGDAAGFTRKIKEFSGGVFTLSLPLPFTPAPGDDYTVVAGCRGRLEEDCRDKFDNVLWFQGEPHLKGLDDLTKPGGTEDQPSTTPDLPAEGA